MKNRLFSRFSVSGGGALGARVREWERQARSASAAVVTAKAAHSLGLVGGAELDDAVFRARSYWWEARRARVAAEVGSVSGLEVTGSAMAGLFREVLSPEAVALVWSCLVGASCKSPSACREAAWLSGVLEEAFGGGNGDLRCCYRNKDRTEYMRAHRSQFEVRSFTDLLHCAKGECFLGYASELLS